MRPARKRRKVERFGAASEEQMKTLDEIYHDESEYFKIISDDRILHNYRDEFGVKAIKFVPFDTLFRPNVVGPRNY